MRMRGVILLALAGLAACGEGDGSGSQASTSTASGDAASPTAAGADRVACALADASAFADACTLERAQVEGAPVLVIRHPDGGFRRFAVKDGSVIEADGAEAATVTRNGNTIEIAVGADRYRLTVAQLGNGQ
jgi:hypothetical protein